MTFGISLYSFIRHQSPSSNMEKRMKLSKNSSSSLPLQLEGQSRWGRCNSFSSCSNDSSLYCNNSHFNVRKRLTNEDQPARLMKRSRHSSGSSVSSNLSSISDKDTKKASITISRSAADCPINNTIVRKAELSSINCSDRNSSGLEYKRNTIVNQTISCSTESSISPFRHNLRRNIRKKTCSCDCTTTCTTLVVRRFKEIGKKTVESKTVISSTKVNSFMPSNGTARVQSPQKSDAGKKRRSEVEKLYASLHEIEWAKNFSPDNILTQLNIRQAAACSVFGGTTNRNSTDRTDRTRRQRKCQKQKCNSGDECSQDSHCEKRNFEKEKPSVFSSPRETRFSNLKAAEQSSFDIKMYGTNFHQYGKKVDSGDFKSSYNTRARVMSNNNSRSDVKPFVKLSSDEDKKSVIVNHVEKVEDSHLSCTSDKLPSIIAVSEAELPSRHFLNYDFKCRSNVELITTAKETECPLIPVFIDIAEEGIRTIDACFREVGAEVVVSTCCDDSRDLPLLSAEENVSSCGSLSNDGPPVLEPLVDLPTHNSQQTECCKLVQTVKNSNSKNDVHEKGKFNLYSQNKTRQCRRFQLESIPKTVHLVCNNHIKKQILKKYLKYIRTRRKSKKSPPSQVSVIKKKGICFGDKLQNNRVKHNNISSNKLENQESALLSVATSPLMFKSSELMYQTDPDSHQALVKTVNRNFSIYSYTDSLMFDYTKNDTTLVGTSKETVNHQSTIHDVRNGISLSQTIEQHSQTSEYLCTKTDENQALVKSRFKDYGSSLIPFTPKLCGFSCHYTCIRVNRNGNYTQVILKYTRGKSIFLTQEALIELKDVVTRVGEDSSCKVLIINGSSDCFCLGLDLKPLIGPQKIKASKDLAVAVKEFVEALADFRKPLAAVINGPAVGLGLTLLNHADVKIASEKATFSMPYALLGYTPEGGATLTLPQAVGSTVAMDLLISGRTLTAREAQNVGLISEVLEDKFLPQELVSRVRLLGQNALSALEATKAMFQIPLLMNLRMVLENEMKLLPRMWLSQACQDALHTALQSGFLSHT